MCKLPHALYGLKQSPRTWFRRLSQTIKKHGFAKVIQIMHYCLSMEREKLQLYCICDDMIIIMDDTREIAKIYKQLATEFEMKNLGGLKYFLEIKVARSKQDIFQSQYEYIYIRLTM